MVAWVFESPEFCNHPFDVGSVAFLRMLHESSVGFAPFSCVVLPGLGVAELG